MVNKAKIVSAAFKVWGRNFYRKTSLSLLARELGVSKPALYRHFENKQALNNAMTESFLDDFAASIQADFNEAGKINDTDNCISIIIKSITGFFAKNVYSLIFSMVNVYERKMDRQTISERLKYRNVNIDALRQIIEKKYSGNSTLIRLVFATLTFLMSHFHKSKNAMENSLSDDDIQYITSLICKTVKHGLGYPAEKTELDFEKLEKQIEDKPLNTEPEPLFKAVAEAVAEVGPWDTSMDMVAKRLGLSKSSLYGHFKSRNDMLRRLFITEFKRIIDFAKQGISLSKNTAEQLYLGIYSISIYLRSRSEILVAMGWIRTRKLDLGEPDKNLEIFRLFEDIKTENMSGMAEEEKQKNSHWILFLLINILTRPFLQGDKYSINCASGNVLDDDIRMFYKFITLGLGGFIR
jgi:AcrR family transcriptional regulator